jgi:hypothetical protein
MPVTGNLLATGAAIGAFLSAGLLAGCGLAETTAATATQAAAAAEQAKQGQALQAEVKRKLDEAQQATRQQLEQAEAQAN